MKRKMKYFVVLAMSILVIGSLGGCNEESSSSTQREESKTIVGNEERIPLEDTFK
ncbi:MAG: hypothetical protein HRT90_10370 [Candidatus Margulisbacteria bacterium]|nr:hypothetical protein [Candidatus Margulisiibacteriota bacterium]